jgi:rRNA-processing protein FCF1
VLAASGSGDDAIVQLCRKNPGPGTLVVTADRGLRERVIRLGVQVRGPAALQLRR